jgi:basic membrane lipoprotein Med (substrate-binding protein (PBP1-ABC) superfamily)
MRRPGRATGVGLAACVMLMVGCAREESPEPRRFTVRLLTSPNVSGRWEVAAERGLGLIAAELDAEVSRNRVEKVAETWQRRPVGAAGKDVDLVFCVGGGFEKELYMEAEASPETDFVLVPGRARGSNVASIDFLPDGAGYLAGVVAAAISSTRRAGILQGTGRPWLEDLERGFEAGFRAHDRRAVVETAHGVEGVWGLSVTDVGVALYAADEPDPEVLAAAREAGVRLIVTDPTLLAVAPDVVVAAVDLDVAEAMLRVAREVRDGLFTGQVYAFDLGSGVLDLTVNSALDPVDLQNVESALETARAEVTAGLVEFDHLGL